MENYFMVEFEGANRAKAHGFLSKPENAGKYPAVIVIHEIWGLVDHIKDVSRRFADEGFVGLAIDLFGGKTVSSLEEGRKIREHITEEGTMAVLNGAFNYLKSLEYVDPKHIGSIGFCMGGGLSLQLACHNKELAGAVVFYGRNPSPIDLVKELNSPILGNYAGADMAIKDSDVNLLEETLKKYGKIFDIKVYPGAPHGFFNDTRENYRPDAAKDAWKRTLNFFNRYLKV